MNHLDNSDADMPQRLCLDTRTKVNAWLRVEPLRPCETLHRITSLFLPLAFGDRLTVSATPSATPDFQLTSNRPDLVVGNTVEAAWRAFLAAFQGSSVPALAVAARLDKRVAGQTGLGSGSGDAGSMLNALNTLHGKPFDKAQLNVIARSVGSDVPFFVDPCSCIVSGDGSEITCLPPFGSLHCCLVIPRFRVSTGEAYRALDQLMLTQSEQVGIPMAKMQDVLNALARRRPLRPAGTCLNVFERVLGENAAIVAQIREVLDSCGAILSTLTGSGSAVFGIYEERAAAVAAARSVRRAIDTAQTVVTPVV